MLVTLGKTIATNQNNKTTQKKRQWKNLIN